MSETDVETEETEETEEQTEATEQTEAAADAEETETVADDWRAPISDPEIKKHAERFDSIESLAKANLDQHKKISRGVIPGKEASDEEMAAFRKAMGVPDSIDDYDIDLPEGADKEILEDESVQEELRAAREIALENNISAEAFKAFAKWDLERGLKKLEDAQKADETFAEEAKVELKKEWGRSFDAEMEYANRGAEWLFGDDLDAFRKLIAKSDDRPLGDHPAIIKAMNKIGRMTSEDTVPLISSTREEEPALREELTKLTEEQDSALRAGDTRKAQALDEKIMDLSKRISGDAPI